MTTYRDHDPSDKEYLEMLHTIAELLNHALNSGELGPKRRRQMGFFINIYPIGDHLTECYCVSAGAPQSEVARMLRALANTVEEGGAQVKDHAFRVLQ